MIDYGSSQSKKNYTRRIGENGFLGADFSTAPIFASSRRFRDMKNVWKDYKSGSGVAIETIPGIRHLVPELTGVSFLQGMPVNGVGFFTVTKKSSAYEKWVENNPFTHIWKDTGNWVICHIGTFIVTIRISDFSDGKTVPTSLLAYCVKNNTVSLNEFPNEKSTIVQVGDCALVITKSGVFKLEPLSLEMIMSINPSRVENGSNLQYLFVVSDMSSSVTYGANSYTFSGYVPTTYINGEPYEQKNMLTTQSKEKFTGVTTSSETQNTGTSTTTVYYVTVRPHERVAGGSSPYRSNIVSVTLDGNSVNLSNVVVSVVNGYVVTIRVDTSDNSSNGTHTVEVVYNSDPTKFTSYQSVEDYKDRTTFNEGNPDYSGTAYDAIAGCTICASFDERIFLAGNPKLPNTIFYSQRDLTGYNNPTYFGVLNYNNLGTSNSPITALVPSANVLYALKDDSATDPTMYVLTGQTTEYDLIPRIYTVESGLPGIGCKGAACNFLDDIVFMSKNGVIGIDKQAVNLERTLGDRSVLINGRLTREDQTKAIFAEWEGYLAVLFTDNGHLYLADSRAYTQGAGYEWYYVDSVGSWTDDVDKYSFSNDLAYSGSYTLESYAGDEVIVDAESATIDDVDFANLTPANQYTIVRCDNDIDVDPNDVMTVYLEYTLMDVHFDGNDKGDYVGTISADTNGDRVYLVETSSGSGQYYQVKPTGEKVNAASTVFHPATCMVALNDRVLFGTEDGKILTFNTDKRGVPASAEECADPTHFPNAKNFAPDMIRPEWYTFCGHRIESYVETEDDDAGVSNATKDTVKRSVVVDMKAMLGSRYKVTTYTDKDGWQNDNAATGAINDYSNVGFGATNFKGDEHVNVQIRERARKWVHKRYRVESNGFKAPFGLYRITYNFEINGRIK